MCLLSATQQLLKNGYQAEVPDIWLSKGNPWEVRRDGVAFEVRTDVAFPRQ